MANPDGLDGICGDREFMNSLYFYYKFKKYLSDSKPNEDTETTEEPETKQIQVCQHYLACTERCLSRISNCPNQDKSFKTYLDYLRWNSDIIDSQLTEFEEEDSLASYHPIISQMKNYSLELREEYFSFSASEQAIANEYIQAYNKVHKNQDFRPILVKQAGRLFINYVSNLGKRCYIDKMDREDVTFAQLLYESEFLIEKLSAIPYPDLAKCVGDTIQAYTDFRSLDAAARVGQDHQLQLALKYAHQRATETALQSAIRTIKGSIHEILATLERKTQEAWDMATTLFNPIQSIKNLIHFGSSPLNSSKQVWNWAKKNPWKTCAILIGGFCLGTIAGAVVVGVTAGALAISTTTLSMSVPYLLSIYYGMMIGGVGAVMAMNGGRLNKLSKEAKRKVDKQKGQVHDIIKQNCEEGENIAMEVVYEEQRREVLKNARERAEADIREMRERNERIGVERRRQMEGMDSDALRTFESELNRTVDELSQHLHETQWELGQSRREIRDNSVDMYSVTQGRDAAARLLERIATRSTAAPTIDN